MPWLVVLGLVVGGYFLYKKVIVPPTPQQLPPGPPPAPGPQPSPTPTPVAGPGVALVLDPSGNITATVGGGTATALSMQSAASALAGLSTAPTLTFAAPAGGGITSVMSSNPLVMPSGILNPANLGQPMPSVNVGSPLVPGKTTLSISWNDSAGNAAGTDIVLTAT